MFLAVAVVSVLVGACDPLAATNATIRREGNTLIVGAPGFREANIQGYLCPEDPGSGPERGVEGHARLLAAGCLDLGTRAAIDPGASGWSAQVNLESLASAQLEAFAGRATYRLVLIAGDEFGGVGFSTDVPAVDLVP
ncbi:MAG TPA: hypothetical protein VFO50_01555 [Candidatus Limnocylindrales bacterium]|nr:hypothetical protein [Candidatus Limnocylindrales bacterium]